MFHIYIVTPVLNAADTIDATIWSVVTQQGDLHIHYHVQDAGSTDGTLEKLRDWQKRLQDPGAVLARIDFTFLSEPDGGIYDGLSKAFARLDIPESAFMGWLGAGDRLWPGAFSVMADLEQDLPEVDWIMGWYSIIDHYGKVLTHNSGVVFPRELLTAGLAEMRHYQCVQQESTFWKKSLWDKAGRLDTSFKLAGDWDLWRRFAQHRPLIHVQCNLGAWCSRPGQLGGDANKYLAEVDAKIPNEVREYRLRSLLGKEKILPAPPLAARGDDGIWQLLS
jgi:hypothetical protein